MALDFTDAIEEVQSTDEFMEWMGKHAPGLIPEVKKDLTAGDVHVASAGGDGKKKKKKPQPPISVAYTPEKGFEDKTFDEAGSSDQAFDYWIGRVTSKAFNPDEPRDERGRWEGGGALKNALSQLDATGTHLMTGEEHAAAEGMLDDFVEHFSSAKSTLSAGDYKQLGQVVSAIGRMNTGKRLDRLDAGWLTEGIRLHGLLIHKNLAIGKARVEALADHIESFGSYTQANEVRALGQDRDWLLEKLAKEEAEYQAIVQPFDKLKIKHKTSIEAEPNELKALTDVLNSNPSIRAVLQAALAVGKATRTIALVRHGATNLNNQDTSVDRIRGWSNVPLSEEGKEEAAKLASKLSKEPPDHLVTSDLARAHDTAKMIAAACDMKIDDVSKGFRPWDVGEFAGKSSKDAVPILAKYAVETPDKKTPGGESFNTFRSRFFNALADAIKTYPGRLAVVTHHRGERLIAAWEKAGHPADGSISGKEFTKKGEGTAGFEDVEIPVDRLNAAASANVTKWVGEPVDYDKVFEDGSAQKDFTLNVCKVDAEKQIFYGWAYVSEEDGKVIVDKQDDYILPEDLVQAAEDFTLHGGKLGDMHDERNVGRVVASFVTSADLCKAFDMSVGNNRRGWILGFKVDDPEVWKKIKSGTQLELSIAGRGVRMEDG